VVWPRKPAGLPGLSRPASKKAGEGGVWGVKQLAIALLKQGKEEKEVVLVLTQSLKGPKKPGPRKATKKKAKTGKPKGRKPAGFQASPLLVVLPSYRATKRTKRYVPV
jgi:hypothetical protein